GRLPEPARARPAGADPAARAGLGRPPPRTGGGVCVTAGRGAWRRVLFIRRESRHAAAILHRISDIPEYRPSREQSAVDTIPASVELHTSSESMHPPS